MGKRGGGQSPDLAPAETRILHMFTLSSTESSSRTLQVTGMDRFLLQRVKKTAARGGTLQIVRWTGAEDLRLKWRLFAAHLLSRGAAVTVEKFSSQPRVALGDIRRRYKSVTASPYIPNMKHAFNIHLRGTRFIHP